MKYSYENFIKMLGLIDTSFVKLMYELYLECLNEQSNKEDKKL